MLNGELVFVYSTYPDEESAVRAATALVQGRLAACVNIHGPMTSVYEWKGALETTREYAVFVKTRRVMAETVMSVMRPLHPYSLPCFLTLPVMDGAEDYVSWVRAHTETPRMA